MRFVLVDEILELDPGSRIRATKTWNENEKFFRDHFPGFPVVPGVLLTEAMAQAAGKCLYAEDPERGRPMLAQIKSASFRNWVRPGERVTLRAEIRASRASYASATCEASVGERPVCSAEVLFSFLPNASFAPEYRDEVLERHMAEAPRRCP